MSTTLSQNTPSDLSSNNSNSSGSPQFHHSPNPNPPRKKLDLDSYFNDLPDSAPPRRSKSVCITRPVRKSLRFRRICKPKRRNTTLTVPPSRDEHDDEEGESSDEEGDEWVKKRWNALLDRQRLAEADVRRTILNRNRLDPLELSQWLDSEDTCTLPLPNLGVQLRMVDQ